MIHMDKTMAKREETASSRILEVLLALLMPPVAVALNKGAGREFVICVFLTVLGFLPGVVYALYQILSEIEEN